MAPVLRSLMQGRGFNFVRAVAASGLLRPLTMGPRLRSVGFVKSSTQNPTVFSRAHVAFAVRSGGHVRWLSAAGEKEEVKAKEGEKDGKAEEAPEGAEAKKAEEGQTGEAKEGKPEASEAEVLESRIQELELQVKRKDEDINELKKRVLTALADVENMRVRMKNKEEDDKKFAVRGFAKSMLEVADVLEKALEAMPEEKRKNNADLQTVWEGVDMTERIFLKGLEGVHIQKFDPMGEKFDPNLHQALFEMPTEEGGEKGLVKAVVKCGYMIHDRVLRPAEVGVTK